MKRQPELVVVTGAGSGIGRATSLRFAAGGSRVVVADINQDTAEETVKLIADAGGVAYPYRVDVADVAALEEFAEAVLAAHGVADVLVNNAGFGAAGTFLDQDPADIDRLLSVNLRAVIHSSRLFGKQMVARGEGGHIVNIASAAAYTPLALLNIYCTSKAAVKMFSACLRGELAGYGIGVTAICPGGISTNIFNNAEVFGFDAEEHTRQRSKVTGLARMLDLVPGHSADSVAKAVTASVRRNTAVRPVTIESWFAYVVASIAPPAMRVATRLSDANTMATWSDRLTPRRVRNGVDKLGQR